MIRNSRIPIARSPNLRRSELRTSQNNFRKIIVPRQVSPIPYLFTMTVRVFVWKISSISYTHAYSRRLPSQTPNQPCTLSSSVKPFSKHRNTFHFDVSEHPTLDSSTHRLYRVQAALYMSQMILSMGMTPMVLLKNSSSIAWVVTERRVGSKSNNLPNLRAPKDAPLNLWPRASWAPSLSLATAAASLSLLPVLGEADRS